MYVLLCKAQSACVGLGHAPRKFLKNRCSEIESEGISETKYHTMYINFKSQNIFEIKISTINKIWRTEGEQVIISSHSTYTNYGINLQYHNNCHLLGANYACTLSLVRH